MKKITSLEAERMIEGYLDRHPESNYSSKIAEDLGLELDVTFELIHKLLDDGRIRSAKGKTCPLEELNDKTTIEVVYDVEDSPC